jgi:hypothetical protein
MGWIAALLAIGLGTTACAADDGVVVGPRGGEVASADERVWLEIPPDALTYELDLRVVEVEGGPKDRLYDAVYAIEPAGVTLARPAAITFELIDDPAGAVIVTQRTEGWVPLPDRDADPDGGMLSASVLYLGAFAVAPHRAGW